MSVASKKDMYIGEKSVWYPEIIFRGRSVPGTHRQCFSSAGKVAANYAYVELDRVRGLTLVSSQHLGIQELRRYKAASRTESATEASVLCLYDLQHPSLAGRITR